MRVESLLRPFNNKLSKVCPQCSKGVNECGHAFPSKREVAAHVLKHRRVHKANMRASETPEQTLSRQDTDRIRKAFKKACETPGYTRLWPRVCTLVLPSFTMFATHSTCQDSLEWPGHRVLEHAGDTKIQLPLC